MEAIRIRGGHRFRLKHRPDSSKTTLDAPATVAMSPRGLGLKTRVVVKEGDDVERGAELFHDKRSPQVKFTAPATGKVKEIRYGPRRRLDAIVIERAEGDAAKDFGAHDRGALAGLGQGKVVEKLVEAGLWHRFVSFPGWEIAPIPGSDEDGAKTDAAKKIVAIYVSALSTEPHLPDPLVALEGNEDLFAAGLEVIKQIPRKTWLMSATGTKVPAKAAGVSGVEQRSIEAKFPAENVGLQSWYTEPLKANELAVGLNVEDVIDVGHLFLKGTLRTDRTYAVAGDAAKKKHHVVAPAGVRVADLVGPRDDEDIRFIAGGLFTGDKVIADDYLSPFDRAVQVMKEDRYRMPFPFFRIGFDRFSLFRLWGSSFLQSKEHEVTTSQNGEYRACVQCGACVDICPVGLMPNLVFKAAQAEDIEKMEEVGIHDCVDCGLCTFVCVSKIELGEIIEGGKTLIAKEG